MTVCVYPDDCRAPATVDGFCEHHWWLVEAEVAEFRASLTERDGVSGRTPGSLNPARALGVLPSRSVSDATLTERDASEGSSAVRPAAIRKDAAASRSVSVDHDPGDCGCEDCR